MSFLALPVGGAIAFLSASSMPPGAIDLGTNENVIHA